LVVCPRVLVVIEALVEGCKTAFTDVLEDVDGIVVWFSGVDAVRGEVAAVKGGGGTRGWTGGRLCCPLSWEGREEGC
jgi:hypothetical protein